jgi:integrase
MADLIDRYIAEVLPRMKGEIEDCIRLKAIKRHPVCKIRLSSLTPTVMCHYRDERLTQVSAGTVIRELAYFSSIINHARREWGINIENSIRMVRKPQSPQGRNRILSATEKQALLVAVKPSGRRNVWLEPVVRLALETAMRRGELLSLRWSNIDLKRRTALLETTKNGAPRPPAYEGTVIQERLKKLCAHRNRKNVSHPPVCALECLSKLQTSFVFNL